MTSTGCARTPSDPPCSQDRPKLTRTRVPPIALACSLAATAATLVSNRADARALAACSALRATRRVRAGIKRWHRARSTWAEDTASRRGYARDASHGPKAPDRAGHCDAASRLGLFQRHRWRLRVREEPSVASLDSSGATGGVLELPGDDYFIYGPAEVDRSALSTACVPCMSTQGAVCRLRVNIK